MRCCSVVNTWRCCVCCCYRGCHCYSHLQLLSIPSPRKPDEVEVMRSDWFVCLLLNNISRKLPTDLDEILRIVILLGKDKVIKS